MSYGTAQDLIDRFGREQLIQLTDHSGAGVIDNQVLTQAMSDSDAEVEGFLVGRYTVPLPSVPKIILGYWSDIVRYRLMGDRSTDQADRRYDIAMKFFRAVADGTISLGPDALGVRAAPAGGPSSSGPNSTTAASRVFTDQGLRSYRDPDAGGPDADRLR
jgi:phage gp36-like protein